MSLLEDLKAEVLTVLGSSAMRHINFVAAAVRISPESYSQLVGRVESGRLPVTIDPSIRGAGQYTADDNTLRVKQYPPFYDNSVVHELTHAAIDLMDLRVPRGAKFSTRGLHQTEDEGIAYIAMCVYCRLTSQPYVHLAPGQQLETRLARMARVADAIAGRILASGTKLYHVSEDEMRWMRNAVGQVPGYFRIRDHAAPSNGIPTR